MFQLHVCPGAEGGTSSLEAQKLYGRILLLLPLFCAILVCQQIRQRAQTAATRSFNKGFRSWRRSASEKNPDGLVSRNFQLNRHCFWQDIHLSTAFGKRTILALLLNRNPSEHCLWHCFWQDII